MGTHVPRSARRDYWMRRSSRRMTTEAVVNANRIHSPRELGLVVDDVVGLGIERHRLAPRLAQRLMRQHAALEELDAGQQAAGLLQRQALEVASPHFLLDRPRALGIEPDRLERAAPERQRGLVGL